VTTIVTWGACVLSTNYCRYETKQKGEWGEGERRGRVGRGIGKWSHGLGAGDKRRKTKG
jgi:hypothetical protein